MSYPKSLDEYTFNELYHEIARRMALMKAGLCSYCEEDGDSPRICRFPERHRKITWLVDEQRKVEVIE